MAKTTSQIIKENKEREKAVDHIVSAMKARDVANHETIEKNRARTLDVLEKAISKTSDSTKRSDLERAHKSVSGSKPKTALDMQKKKEDRLAEKNPVDSLQIKKDRAQKNLDDYEEKTDFDATDTNARKQFDMEIDRLKREVSKVDAEIDQRTMQRDLETIESMTDEDRAAFDKYVRGGTYVNAEDIEAHKGLKSRYDNLDQLKESYERNRDEKKVRQVTEETAQKVQDGGWITDAARSLVAVPANIVGGVTGTAGRINELFNRSDRYKTLAPYTLGDIPSTYGQTVQSEVTGKILDGQEMNLTDGISGREIAAMAYQGGNSLLEIAGRIVLGLGNPAMAAGLAATQSFANSMTEATKQGATPAQAVILSVGKAGLEAATEKIPLDDLFDIAKNGLKSGGWKMLKQVFAQAGTEITEEEISLFGGLLMEAAVLREKSSYKQNIGDLVAGGMPYEEAREQADKSVWNEALQTAAVSGIAGGFSGGGAAIIGNLNASHTMPEEITQGTAEETPVVEPAQPESTSFLDDTAHQLMQEAPAAELEALTPEQQMIDLAAAETMGVQPEVQPAIDTTQQTEYDNNMIIVPGATVGRSGITYTADNKPVQFQYAVVPAESLVTSNDQFGNVNKLYPAELQPRDRTRAASQTQINSMSRNLNPALLAESPTAQNGAPIIRGDGVVIGGNGRVSAITQAYGSGRGAEYQQYITERAEELGIDPATLPANPVLVRVTNGVDNYTELANSLNASTTATYSATEAAKADAGRVGDIIEYLSVSEDGSINTADNKDFIQKFVSQVVPDTERGDVMQANGQLSQAGERRIQNALFAYAYGDTALIERLTERTDSNIKNITGAMLKVSGKVATLQNAIDSGEVQDLGVRAAITDAVNLYLDAKNSQQTVTDAASQLMMGENGVESQYDGLTVHVAKALETFSRSGKQMQTFFAHLIDNNLLAAAEDAGQTGMFDAGGNITQEELYDQTVQSFAEAGGRADQLQPKSDFSQYREYQPEAVLEGMGGTGAEGASSSPEADGRNNGSVSQRLPGRQSVTAQPTPQANNAGIKGTGAAEINFSQKPAYNATLSEDNAQADRRGDVRHMELPQRDINGGNVSAVTGNVYGAGVTPDEFASLMEEPTARGDFSYVPISNNEATQQAMENISRYGWQDAYTQWSNAVHQGRAGAEMSARGALFLNHAAQAGDRQQWLNILSDFQRLGTNTAQGLQAFRILRNLAPSDRLYMMRRSVAQMVEDMHLNVPIEIDQQLADQYQNAQTNEEADAILDEIIDDVAAQIPSTAPDRWTALRYVNMLGNMRTQARNISGNIGAKFTYLAKDQIGAALEKVAHAFNPDFQRTKSAWVSNELKALGRVDFDEVRDIVLENGRFDDSRRFDSTYFAREVNERRRIFRNGFMESYRRLTNWAMNNDYFGDAGFAKAAYARAFGGYLKANGFTGDTLEGIDQNLLDDARLYAIQQAQESTFRDHNAVSDWVGRIGRRQDTPRAIRTLSEGVMPFRSTPANVLVRAEEFSPLGIINTAVTAARAANPNSEITGTDVVESMAKTLTGTGLFIMGAYLGKMGALAGGPDPDDEKAEFDQMNGYQNYALQLGDGKNITIDFLSPLAVPMFLGAEFEKIISDGGYDLADFETVFTSLADPLIQMSMLQGLNDTLDGIKYSENNLGQFFLNASMSYLTQGLTNTLMGQLERSSEENRMTTYIDKDSGTPQWLQRQLGKMSQKIPGWDYQQGEYLNAWGQTEKNEGGLLYNLLSPGYISTEHSDLVSRELYRLRETTGENVFPQTVEKTVSFTDTDGNHHAAYNLSQSELETMQKVEGQTAARLMAEVMTNGDYSGLTDKQKAQVVENIYSYAQEEARKQALPKYYSEASAWMRELGDDAANGLIRRATLSTINSSVTNTVDNIENGWDVTPAAKQDLDSLYDAYAGMSKEAKKQILDDAISDTAKFLEIRSHGVRTDQYLDVVTDIKDQPLQTGYSQIRDAQTYRAIAESDTLSDVQKDYVMKAYMPDYDPNAKTVDRTELKYDYMIEEGYSRTEFATAYDIYSHEKTVGGKGTADRTRERMCQELGIKMSEAKMLYKLFGGYYKPWEE